MLLWLLSSLLLIHSSLAYYSCRNDYRFSCKALQTIYFFEEAYQANKNNCQGWVASLIENKMAASFQPSIF